MRSGPLTSLAFLGLLLGLVKADFGVWRIQESVAASGSFEYPLLTGGDFQSGDFQSGADVYNCWVDYVPGMISNAMDVTTAMRLIRMAGSSTSERVTRMRDFGLSLKEYLMVRARTPAPSFLELGATIVS
ncbi:Fc.00g104190.m01.CDS01 [Cosmosporella sp. VM-42]